ncbi:hypothetical protein BB560_002263 [Smittium megazygosporum]|uniref:Endonuclease/exonuclease/phosphatase domain-containing protein n=1 Tax=Smittium megazygosporum TaxID=133381 RepID=A0A2T9ZFG2_9FUNG|nr:hypothetical protein BB560_002263 [Smittium megazygosporum]
MDIPKHQRHPNNIIKETKQKKTEKLKIFSYNIRGFKGSKLELEYILSKRRPNIIGIQESLLTRDTNRCNINGYTCIESKSNVAKGGNGLIMGVKNGFGIKIYEYKSTPYWLIGKLTATTTTNTNFNMYVVNVHIPSTSIRKRKALESLEKALQKLKNNKNDVKIIVMGDFNMDKKQVLNWIRKLGIGLQLNNVTNSKGSRRVGTEMGRMIDHILHNDALNPPNYCIIAHAMDLDLFINNNRFSVLAELESTQNVDEISSKFTEIIHETANEFTNETPAASFTTILSKKTRKMIDKRRKLYKNMLNNIELVYQYLELKQKSTKRIKKDNLRFRLISNDSESQTAISGLGRRVGQLDAGQTENAEYQGTKPDQSPHVRSAS